ncbi:MAG TPA: GMP synthase [Chitinophagaceae bacterium]
MTMSNKQFRIAILDLYEGEANEGMRCIRQIISEWASRNGFDVIVKEFDVRLAFEVPDLSFDVYISSGGPGSPLETEGNRWESLYFGWLKSVEDWNSNSGNISKKHVYFICHSFQLACRHYQLGNVCKRKSTAFGVFPVHMTEDGRNEPVFANMPDPFYAVDSRDYQVIEPDYLNLLKLGATILAIEKDRPHVPYERAIMGIRFNEYFIGTQFHPEADAGGMRMYLQRADKKETVIANHGEAKWKQMVDDLADPSKIMWTYAHILPDFLDLAVGVNVMQH